jgi:hypothetical protein
MPHGTLQVFIIILYENVFQNPELFRTQVSLSPEHSTLVVVTELASLAPNSNQHLGHKLNPNLISKLNIK